MRILCKKYAICAFCVPLKISIMIQAKCALFFLYHRAEKQTENSLKNELHAKNRICAHKIRNLCSERKRDAVDDFLTVTT